MVFILGLLLLKHIGLFDFDILLKELILFKLSKIGFEFFFELLVHISVKILLYSLYNLF